MMDTKTKGAWVLHHTHKLEKVTNQQDFYNILTAGKMGVLLSAIAETHQRVVKLDRVRTLAIANNISPLEQDSLLSRLRGQQLIDVQADEVQIIGITSASVLQHTADAFDELGPSAIELSSLSLAEMASVRPVTRADSAQYIQDEFELSKAVADDLYRAVQEIGFVDSELIEQERVYFNGNLFRRDVVKKATRVLDTLSPNEAQSLRSLEAQLQKEGCIELATAKAVLGDTLFEKVQSIGFLDVHGVENERGRTLFVTRPAAFGKFFHDDSLDLAKSLVACLTYGMKQSPQSRGRIAALPLLLRRLINGTEIGPATAIGKDYHALEYRGVVAIRAIPNDNRCYMRLLKRDVGELALQVLTSGDASHESLPNLPSAAVNRYVRPESQRASQRATLSKRSENDPSRTGAQRLLRALREQ